jgi:hypothetical protein
MSERDLDLLYERATRDDPARPSAAVRQAILDQARVLAAPSRVSRWAARWLRLRWLIAVAPVAAAVLAVIVLQPQLRSTLPAPASPVSAPVKRGSAAGAAAATSSEPVRPAPASPSQTLPPAPRPSPAARMQVRAAPASPAAIAPATSQGDLLQQAAVQGDVGRVRALLRVNAGSINARDTRGRTALLLAVLHRRDSVVRALLARGADPNIADADGRTPLAVARDQNQLPMVEALLRAGAR